MRSEYIVCLPWVYYVIMSYCISTYSQYIAHLASYLCLEFTWCFTSTTWCGMRCRHLWLVNGHCKNIDVTLRPRNQKVDSEVIGMAAMYVLESLLGLYPERVITLLTVQSLKFCIVIRVNDGGFIRFRVSAKLTYFEHSMNACMPHNMVNVKPNNFPFTMDTDTEPV